MILDLETNFRNEVNANSKFPVTFCEDYTLYQEVTISLQTSGSHHKIRKNVLVELNLLFSRAVVNSWAI